MIYVQLDMGDLKAINSALGKAKDKSKLIIRRAINNTAKKAEKYMYKEAHSEYKSMAAAKQKAAVKITQKATTSNLEAIIKSVGPVHEVYKDYKYHKLGNGYSASIRGRYKRIQSSDGSRQAFLVTYGTGHTTIAIRKGEKRLPIHSIIGPSIPKQMGYMERGGSVSTARQEKTMRDVSEMLRTEAAEAFAHFMA